MHNKRRRTHQTTIVFGFLWLFACTTGPLFAETFHLTTGSVVEGRLLNPDQNPRTTYEIGTSVGKITLAAKQVAQVVTKPQVLQQYEASLPKVPNTVEGHLEMARKCRDANLFPQRDFHLQEVLRIDPDHQDVRAMLGYVKINGQWRKEDVLMRQQGYIRDGGRWRTKQEVAIAMAVKQVEEEEIQWRVKILRWESLILRNRPNAAEALTGIREIRDYRATKTLAERLNEPKLPRDMKLIYLDVLTQIGGTVPVEAMLKCISNDPDDVLRHRCLDQLRLWQSRRAMTFFVSLLSSNDNQRVNSGGYALGELGMHDSLLPLIKALRTKHKQTIGGGNNINANFSPNQSGQGGLQFGGKPKIVEQLIVNRSVHSAILAIVPQGINFGYDQEKWMEWYVRINTPANINLRREAQN